MASPRHIFEPSSNAFSYEMIPAGDLVLLALACLIVASSILASIVVLLLISCGFNPQRPYLYSALLVGSVLHSASCVYTAFCWVNHVESILWIRQFVSIYGFMSILFSIIYQLQLFSLFSTISSLITPVRICGIQISFIFIHLLLCFPVYYNVYNFLIVGCERSILS